MAYITLDDLVERFGRGVILSVARDQEDDTGEGFDLKKIDNAIQDAAGEMDSALAGGGYRLPLASVPPILGAYGCDIAHYRLYKRAPEQETKRYDDAIKGLRLIASGALKLGLPKVDDDVTSAGDVMMVPGRRTFPGGVF